MGLTAELLASRLAGRAEVGGGLVRHEFLVPAALAATYRCPGQYVSAAIAGKDTYFALAGDPGAATWDVLIRAGGDVADALLALPIGGELALSHAHGDGFPMAEAAGRRLFVVATGSGVAAVRPVVRARVHAGLAASTEVFLGVRRRDDAPLADEIAAHRAAGVEISVCCSREPGDGAGTSSGYVQEALLRRAALRPDDVAGGMVFAAGRSAMIQDLRKIARDLSMTEADVRTNY